MAKQDKGGKTKKRRENGRVAFKTGRHSLTRCREAVDVDERASCNRSKDEV